MAISNPIVRSPRAQTDSGRALRTTIDTPEMQLLFACLPGGWSDAHHNSIAECANRIQDWDVLLQLAARHRMVPQLAWALNRSRFLIPETPRAVLDDKYRHCVKHGLVIKRELNCIASVFAEAGIPLGVLKGPAVEQQVYDGTQCRQYKDLDLVVKADQLFEACAVLRELGFTGQIDQACSLDARDFLRLRKYYRHVCASKNFSGVRVNIELHWSISESPLRNQLFEQEFWEGMPDIPIANSRVRSTTGADLVIFLSYHGGKHRWKRLSWLCDFVRAVERSGDLEWDALYVRAKQLGLDAYLDLGLTLLTELVPACRIPPQVQRSVNEGSNVSRAVTRAYHAMIADELHYENSVSTLQWLFELKHSNADRFRAIAAIVRPSDAELLAGGWLTAYCRRFQRAVGRAVRLDR